MQSLTDVAVES